MAFAIVSILILFFGSFLNYSFILIITTMFRIKWIILVEINNLWYIACLVLTHRRHQILCSSRNLLSVILSIKSPKTNDISWIMRMVIFLFFLLFFISILRYESMTIYQFFVITYLIKLSFLINYFMLKFSSIEKLAVLKNGHSCMRIVRSVNDGWLVHWFFI